MWRSVYACLLVLLPLLSHAQFEENNYVAGLILEGASATTIREGLTETVYSDALPLKLGAEGMIISVNQKQRDPGHQLATATLTQLEPIGNGMVRATFKWKSVDNAPYPPTQGDLMLIDYISPHFLLNSTLFDLGSYGIYFERTMEDEGTMFYTQRDLILHDNPVFAVKIYSAMLDDVHALAEYLMQNSAAQYTQTIPGGRLAGLPMLDAMSRTEIGDVIDFLEFVQAYPAKYLATDWRFTEVFATWLINGMQKADDE